MQKYGMMEILSSENNLWYDSIFTGTFIVRNFRVVKERSVCSPFFLEILQAPSHAFRTDCYSRNGLLTDIPNPRGNYSGQIYANGRLKKLPSLTSFIDRIRGVEPLAQLPLLW